MKKIMYKIVLTVLLLASPCLTYAQLGSYEWAIAVWSEEKQDVSIKEYQAFHKDTIADKWYWRIDYIDWRLPGESMYQETRYGFRTEGRRLYIYDFERHEERLGFDFNLQAGDEFTTYNGERWRIESAGDTLIKDSLSSGYLTHEQMHRLLKVRNVENGEPDQWLEGFGSFANHLCVERIKAGETSQLLWVNSPNMYSWGFYITREISADPLFSHYSGWLPRVEKEDEWQDATYSNGTLVVKNRHLQWEWRYYAVFFRKGDDVYCKRLWDLPPHVDGDAVMRADEFSFTGLPAPASGKYTLHLEDGKVITSVPGVVMGSKAPTGLYDLQGRQLPKKPANGVYIEQGRKVIAR